MVETDILREKGEKSRNRQTRTLCIVCDSKNTTLLVQNYNCHSDSAL